ncbi:MAG: hypothetical protein RL328_1420 [Acidobacteriota bacterium]|jgi:hypothetical protein
MKLLPVLAVGLLGVLPGSGQSVMTGVGSTVHLVNEDLAVLEAQIPRKDLPCKVEPEDPEVGFDLRFHGGYAVTISLKELAGAENLLRILFRVTADARPDEPVFFQQNFRVPMIPEDAGGDSTLTGTFDIGEGKYHVDWLMRDRQNRVCAFFWDPKADLPSRDRDMELAIAANAIQATQNEQFVEDPPVQRNAGPLLNVKVMVNFAPQNQNSSAMRPSDTLALVTMMRRVTRDPRIGRFSLVAFNIQEQRVVYRQASSDRIEFPALGEAIEKIEPGLVDLKLLANKRGEEEFLAELIKTELASADRPDALVFAGPKYMVDGSPEDELKKSEGVDYPVFYLNYNLNPAAVPWRDSIGKAIRVFGGKEYTITRPRDLFFAVTEMVGRIVESRQGRGVAPASK